MLDGTRNPLVWPGRLLAVIAIFALVEAFRWIELPAVFHLVCYGIVVVFYAVDPDIGELQWE